MTSTPPTPTTLLTPRTKADTLSALRHLEELLASMPAQTPCWACDHFDHEGAICRHWKAVVPVEARVAGCSAFEDLVPF